MPNLEPETPGQVSLGEGGRGAAGWVAAAPLAALAAAHPDLRPAIVGSLRRALLFYYVNKS